MQSLTEKPGNGGTWHGMVRDAKAPDFEKGRIDASICT
jgi:hypothetical protein